LRGARAVQIRENWADVTGKIVSIRPSDHEYDVIDVKIQDASDVPSVPNLFGQRVGKVVTVEMPQVAVAAAHLEEGGVIKARLRLASPSVAFAHPNLIERLE
jgi:hypothetical protein